MGVKADIYEKTSWTTRLLKKRDALFPLPAQQFSRVFSRPFAQKHKVFGSPQGGAERRLLRRSNKMLSSASCYTPAFKFAKLRLVVEDTTSESGGMKYAVIGLLLLLGAGIAAAVFLTGGEEETKEVAQEPPPEPEEKKVAYADEMEIPEDLDELKPEEPDEAPKKKFARAANCKGDLPIAEVRKAVARYGGEVRSCYEKALKNNNVLQGKLTVRMNVAKSGSVSHVSFGGLNDGSLRTCVRQRAIKWSFPKPIGGCATVSAPFSLVPRS